MCLTLLLLYYTTFVLAYAHIYIVCFILNKKNMKCRKQIPTMNCFNNYLKLKIQIEKEIALNNDTLHIFEQKMETH